MAAAHAATRTLLSQLADAMGVEVKLLKQGNGLLPAQQFDRAALNQEYVDPDHPVADGDEVAFFPPVTGG